MSSSINFIHQELNYLIKTLRDSKAKFTKLAYLRSLDTTPNKFCLVNSSYGKVPLNVATFISLQWPDI